MANRIFSFEQSDSFEFQDQALFTNANSNSAEYFLPFDYGIYQYNHSDQQPHEFLDYTHLDDPKFGILPPQIPTCYQEITQFDEIQTENNQEWKNEKPSPFSLASLELLKTHSNSMRIIEPGKYVTSTNSEDQELSTEEIMRIAGTKFVQSSCQLNNPFNYSFYGLSNQDHHRVELAETLMASAEKIGNQQFESANRLLKQIDSFSSDTGNPVQRVVYYFAEALRDRIDFKTGKKSSKDLVKKQSFDIDNAMMNLNPTILACYSAIPYGQITQFSGIQAIIDNLADAKKIHIIDLAVRNGMPWTILMQALVSRHNCPIELLKITAIGTSSKESIEDTGKRLTEFAVSMNLPFLFKTVFVSDYLDLKEDLLGLDKQETVAVYSVYMFRTLIRFPNRLESIMKMLKRINPCVIVVVEVEANHNSPNFVNRFIEALFFYSAYFDCLDECMKLDNESRKIIESMYFGDGIKNIIANEGEDRTIRSVKLDVWRAFFARFGLKEIELSSSSLLQANLIVKKFACGKFCTFDTNGQSLILGWKATPLHSLSCWKFISEEQEENC